MQLTIVNISKKKYSPRIDHFRTSRVVSVALLTFVVRGVDTASEALPQQVYHFRQRKNRRPAYSSEV
jgi:hypothetical protein